MSVRLRPLGAMLAGLAAMLLAGCASQQFSLGGSSSEPPPAQPSAAPLPASIPAADLVGRWGLAAYHKEEDRARTESRGARPVPPALQYRARPERRRHHASRPTRRSRPSSA